MTTAQLTADLKAKGFCRTRTIGSTKWALCESEGIWWQITPEGQVGQLRIAEYYEGGDRWHLHQGHEERDADRSFTRLARRHSQP